MKLSELKALVLLTLTTDEVRAFGDLRKLATWQAANDSINKPTMTLEEMNEFEQVDTIPDEWAVIDNVITSPISLSSQTSALEDISQDGSINAYNSYFAEVERANAQQLADDLAFDAQIELENSTNVDDEREVYINPAIVMVLILTGVLILTTRIYRDIIKPVARVTRKSWTRNTRWLNEVRNLYHAY
jgi:hypothetical protein